MNTIIPPMSTDMPMQSDLAGAGSGADTSVTVNGEPRPIPSGTTVAGLLGLLGLEPRKIAVERNLEIVPKSLYTETQLSDGDRIEIVQFVGGG